MTYGNTVAQFIYYNLPFPFKSFLSSFYGLVQKRHRYGAFYHSHLQSLQRSQWLPEEELEEFQVNQIKAYLTQVNNHSKFYRDLFRKYGFQPEKFKSLSDLSNLPITKKETIRKNIKQIIADNWKKYKSLWAHTSGTTGTALRFPISLECFQREYAFRSLHYQWGNIREEERKAYCSGHPVAYYNREVPPYWVYDYVNNSLLLSSYHLSEKNLPAYIEELEKFEPDLLAGYPSSIYLLALANQDLGRPIRPRAVYTTSETLFNFQREVIEKSFGCKAFMWYGNSEMCANIVECDKGKYHLKPEHSYVEFIASENELTQGTKRAQMICTGFGNLSTPLIRYSVEDVVILSEERRCTCGRAGRIIDQVEGRMEDYIITPDGRFVGRLDHIFKDSTNVKLAQIVQNSHKEVILHIVRDSRYTKRDEEHIMRQTRLRLGGEINIYIEYVDDIARTSNGKFRFIISSIAKKMIQSVDPC